MTVRIDLNETAPEATKAMFALENYVRHSSLDRALVELVKIRVSQINGCAFCIDMHTKDARAAGESEQRIYALSAWREAPFFDARERAALAWAEAVTRLEGGAVPDAIYDEASDHYGPRELVDLTCAVVAINGWNRLAIALGREVGSYQPKVR